MNHSWILQSQKHHVEMNIDRYLSPYRNLPAGSGINVAQVFQGSAAVLFINAVGQVLVYVVQAFFARTMGAEEYGIYTYVYSWLGILLIFSLIGLDVAVVRFLPAYQARSEWENAKGLYIFSRQLAALVSVCIAAIVGLLILWLDIDYSLKLTFVMACLLLPVWTQFRLYHGILQALRRVVYSQILMTMVRPLLLLSAVMLASYVGLSKLNSVQLMAGHVFAMIVLTIIAWRIVRQTLPDQYHSAHPVVRMSEWLRVSFPLSFVSGMRIVLTSTDIILVGILLGTTEAGIYTVASRITQLMVFGNSASNAVMAPLISQLYEQRNFSQLQKTVLAACWFSTASAIVIGIITIGGSSFLLGFYGERFVEGTLVLVILGSAQILNSTIGPVGHLLNMTAYQDVNSKILATVVILNPILSYPAILYWGISGAAMATALVTILNNIWAWYAVFQRMNINSSIFSNRPLYFR